MTDAFLTLGLPRCVVLDGKALQEAYADRSRIAHPDHGGDETKAAEVNAAYETLRAPDRRLKHLLELVAPDDAKQWRTVPMDDALMGLFLELGKALEASAKFIERKSNARTALAKAVLAHEEMQHRETLERLGFDLENRRVQMEESLPQLEAALHGDGPIWKQLGALQAKFAYLAKWQTQIRERLLALM